MDDDFFKIFVSIVQDGSNDPKNPSRLSVLKNGVTIVGQVSADDPDYFYIPIPPGMKLSALKLTNFSSSDPIAFVALQSGEQFSAGQDRTKMVFGSHFTHQSVGANLLSNMSTPLVGGVVLWVNQTGSSTNYAFFVDFTDITMPTLLGTDASESLSGTDQSDVIFGGLGNDSIDGGGGLDTAVFSGVSRNHEIKFTPTGSVTVEVIPSSSQINFFFPNEGLDTLQNIERIQFLDKTFVIDGGALGVVALDTSGIAGQAYRIYKAAFNRTPDKGGLGYWMAQMDQGMDVVSVAARFIDSPEFRSLYGQNPTNAEFLTRVYSNVLARAPDDAGLAWWVNEMKTNSAKTWEKVLADFSESTENKAAVAPIIATGVEYVPWTPPGM